ncbi:hypothetical protein CGRA01v4_13622 [Colletotrichum graminicola]|nr:hypothetical protein CGRA01v4_13622 [Colletotrichum graminicola]
MKYKYLFLVSAHQSEVLYFYPLHPDRFSGSPQKASSGWIGSLLPVPTLKCPLTY